jgi:hypothetical protein
VTDEVEDARTLGVPGESSGSSTGRHSSLSADRVTESTTPDESAAVRGAMARVVEP